MKLKEMT